MNLQQQTSPQALSALPISDSGCTGLRACSKCGIGKPLTEFFAEKRGSQGRRYSCKACDMDRNRVYLAKRTAPRVRQKKTDAEYALAYRVKHRAKELVRHAQNRAAKMGIPFSLSEHIAEIQARIDKGVCELTGLPMPVRNGRHWDTPSIDRIEPSKGFVLENIRVVCLAVNCALGFWGVDVLLKISASLKARL